MLDLEKIKVRAKEGHHYSKWLFVHDLIAEIESLREQLQFQGAVTKEALEEKQSDEEV